MEAEKPTAAFVLSLIGGIITLIAGFVTAAIGAFIAGLGALGGPAGAVVGGVIGLTLAMGFISGIIIIVGSALMYTTKRSRVRIGSILVLVFAIIAIPFTYAGLIIGFVLCLVGAILGLVWKPSAPIRPPPAPPS